MKKGVGKRRDELEAPGFTLAFKGKLFVGIVGIALVLALSFALISLIGNYGEFFGVEEDVRFAREAGLATLGVFGDRPDCVINETIGLYLWSDRSFHLNNDFGGPTDIAFNYGPAQTGWIPITGDWDGDGDDTIGLYQLSNSGFHLNNEHHSLIKPPYPSATDIAFTYGDLDVNWYPIVGDWDGDGIDTAGLYNKDTSKFYLKNSHTGGIADISFTFEGPDPKWIPIAGDWDGDGIDTVGLYDQDASGFHLKNSHEEAPADITFVFGNSSFNYPLAGDWDGDGSDTIGLYKRSSSKFYLKNSNTEGNGVDAEDADLKFQYGTPALDWVPIAGLWDRSIHCLDTRNVVAYYKFNGNTQDISGNENHETRQNWLIPAEGITGTAFNFDGVDDYVNISYSTELGLGVYTVSAWIKPVPDANDPTVVWRGIVGKKGRNYNMWYNADSDYIVHSFCDDSSWYNTHATPANSIIENEWNHVVITNNGTVAKTYINGVQKGVNSVVGDLCVNSTDLWMGINLDSAVGNYFKGVIEEVKIWNVTLSTEEVKNEYEGQALIAYYPFNVDADDYTGNNFHGNMVGSAEIVDDALLLDGSENSGVQLINSVAADFFEYRFSYSLWFKPATLSGGIAGSRIMSRDCSDYHCLLIDQNGTDGIERGIFQYFSRIEDGSGWMTLANPLEWHHAVTTWDVSKNESKLYLDGQLLHVNSTIKPFVNSLRPIVLGGNTEGEGILTIHNFNGSIDEVKLWNKVLTLEDVQNEYAGHSPKGLIAYYNFDGNSLDHSGYGLDGNLVGGPVVVDGVSNSAYDLDGADDHIEVPDSLRLSGFDEMTFSAWVNIDQLELITPLSKFGSYRIVVSNDGAGHCTIATDDYAWYTHSPRTYAVWPAGSIKANQWHLITCVYDGSNLLSYIDGEPVASGQGLSGKILDTTTPFRIGYKEDEANVEWTDGSIDEVKIWNHALSADEVRNEYSSQFCIDSDKISIYTKGSTVKGDSNNIDTCEGVYKVKEWACQNNEPVSIIADCPVRCFEGACICDMRDTLVQGESKIYTFEGLNYNVSINLIDIQGVELNINGTITPRLVEDGQPFTHEKGIISVIKNLFTEKVGETSSAELCLNRVRAPCFANDTVGLYDPFNSARGAFHFITELQGPTDFSYTWGPYGNDWVPISGDWNGDGIDTAGYYYKKDSSFHLSNTHGGGTDISFLYGTSCPGNPFWLLDANGDGAQDAGDDTTHVFGLARDIPVVGDWDNDGFVNDTGVFRNGVWVLDMNGNKVWDDGVDAVYTFGMVGDIPVVGDWDSDGKVDDIGVVRGGGLWILDSNGNGQWENGVDTVKVYGTFGDIPVVGDWDGDGKVDDIGVVRGANIWLLDVNNNMIWDEGTDVRYLYGIVGDVPVVGDWDNDGFVNDTGVFRNGVWVLDMNSNKVWDQIIDAVYTFGTTGDLPVVGDWDNDGKVDDISIFRTGCNPTNWEPIAGDWNGDGIDSVGLYNRSDGSFHLNNELHNLGGLPGSGGTDIYFTWGGSKDLNWTPITGDWDGDGNDTLGLYYSFGQKGSFHLINQHNGPTDIAFEYGPNGSDWIPIAGDWDGDRIDTVGYYQNSTGSFNLSNTPGAGGTDIFFSWGPKGANWIPITGNWILNFDCEEGFVGCLEDANCNDGIVCTDNFCNQDTKQCYFTNNDANCGAGRVCDPANFATADGCGALQSCIDKDGDDIFEYDPDTCVAGRDVCPGTNESFFDINPTESVSNYIPIVGDDLEINVSELNETNLFAFEDLVIQTNDGKIKFEDPVSLIRLNSSDGCFVKINFSDEDVAYIEEGKIYLNSDYHVGFDDPDAELTFYDINYSSPRIYRGSRKCSSSTCNITDYDKGDFLKATVTGFVLYQVKEGPSCGNDVCDKADGGETCQNCPTDCSCPDDCLCVGVGGSTGVPYPNATCQESWGCTSWGVCVNGRQTRTCTDARNCGTIESKPRTDQSCTITIEGEREEIPSDVGKILFWVFIVLLILIIIAVLVILLIAFFAKKGEKPAGKKAEPKTKIEEVVQTVVISPGEKKLIKNSRKFVKQSRKKGFTDEQIKESFRKKKWPEEMIDKVFAE